MMPTYSIPLPLIFFVALMLNQLPKNKKTSFSNTLSLTFMPIGICSLVLLLTALAYSQLGKPPTLKIPAGVDIDAKTPSDPRLSSIQAKIKTDKQNGELWFSLGNEYMALNEFENAALVYQYAQRLSARPEAGIYAAQATARYYALKQNIDNQTQTWLDNALALEPNNTSALILIANDHFLSGQYQSAVDYWVKILDANEPATDRAAIIRLINQARGMI